MKFSLWANLYPSENAPYYGTFVRSAYEGWQMVLGVDCTRRCVIDKPSIGIASKIMSYAGLYLKCLVDILFRRPHLVEIHYPYFFVPLLFLFSSTSAVLRFHGTDLEKIKASKIMFYLFSVVAPRVACIVVPSEYYKKRVISELLFKGKVIVVAPDCVDANFYPIEKAADQEFVIGSVGRLDVDKNVQEIIHALSMTKNTLAKLLIVGGGPYRDRLESLALELGVSDRIEWVGLLPRNELVEYFNKMSVFVFSSVRSAESFGLVGLEALACGVPVLARRSLEGAKEYLDTENSILYDDSASSLAESIDYYSTLTLKDKTALRNAALDTASKFNYEDVVIAGVKRILACCNLQDLKG